MLKNKALPFAAVAVSMLMAAGVAFAQTATPTPMPTTSPTASPTTMPSAAPATGHGG